jgi:hypothetical protein
VRINLINQRFVFALVWTIGGSVKTESRKKLDVFIKKMFMDGIGGPADAKRKKV